MKNPNSCEVGAFQMSFIDTLESSICATNASPKSSPMVSRFYWDQGSHSYELWRGYKGWEL